MSAPTSRQRRARRFALAAAAAALLLLAAEDHASYAQAIGRGAWPWLLLPLLVAALAAGLAYALAAWLHGPGERPSFGAGRGAVVGLATCIVLGLLALAGLFANEALRGPNAGLPHGIVSMSLMGLGPGLGFFASLGAGAAIGAIRADWERRLEAPIGERRLPAPIAHPAEAQRDRVPIEPTVPAVPTWPAGPLPFVCLFLAAAAFAVGPTAILLAAAAGPSWSTPVSALLSVLLVGALARLFYRPRSDGRYGALRGMAVALLGYLGSVLVALPLHEIEQHTHEPLGALIVNGFGLALYALLAGGWLYLGFGALVGVLRPAVVAATLRGLVHRSPVRARTGDAGAAGTASRAGLALERRLRDAEAAARSGWQRAVAGAGAPGAAAGFVAALGLCAFVTAASLGFLLTVRGGSRGGYDDGGAAALAFPGSVALALGLLAWLAAHRAAPAVPPRHRGLAAIVAAACAVGSVLLMQARAWP